MFMAIVATGGSEYDSTVPTRGIQTTNETPTGPRWPEVVRSVFSEPVKRASRPVGIAYIDQAVGGVADARGDATAGPRSGIRSYRSRTQPFTGEFIGGTQPVQIRTQGQVGLSNRAGVGVRAKSALKTNLPDDGAVVAAFTNPAFASLLARMRGTN